MCKRCTFWVCLALITVYAAWSAFSGLTDTGVYDWDEARHGVNAYEMMERGDYILSTYDGEIDYWNVKPPMSMWAIILGYRLFGPSVMGLRFFSALSLPLVVLAAMLFLRRYVGFAAALTTGFLFAATGTKFPHLFLTGDADALFFLFCLLSVVCLYMAYQGSSRWLIGTGLFAAFAFLTRSMHVVVVLATVAVTLLVFRKQRRFSAKEFLLYLVLPLSLPVLIWAGLRITRDGVEFFRQLIVLDVINRVTTVVENNTGGLMHYPAVLVKLLGNTLSAGLFLLIASWLLMDLTNSKRTRNDRMFLVVFGGLFFAVMVIFTLATTKLDRYMYPCIIGLFMIAGYAVQRMLEWLKVRKFRAFSGTVLLCGLLLGAIGSYLPSSYYTEYMEKLARVTAEESVFKALEDQTILPGYIICLADGSPDDQPPSYIRGIPQSWLCDALFRGTTHIHGGVEAHIPGETYVVLKFSTDAEQESFLEKFPDMERISTGLDDYGYRYVLYL